MSVAEMQPGTGLSGTPFGLEGRLALVTGARRGIGLAMTEALAYAGADIIGLSRDLEPDGGDARARVEAAGRSFEAITADLSRREDVDAAIAQIDGLGRAVDVLINNAGTIYREPAVTHSVDEWDRIIETNLTSQFVLAQALGRRMVERQYGKIIFTASMLSFQGGINVASYTASKHAVTGITKALANEWASSNVNVNAIAPGYIATDNTQALREDSQRSTAILERIPAARWGLPADIGWTAVYLSSSASDYVNGAVIPVDGGWLGR